MIQDESEKVLVDRAIEATSEDTFEKEFMSLKANPTYEGYSDEEIKAIAEENCKSEFKMLHEQRANIKPIAPTKNYHQP